MSIVPKGQGIALPQLYEALIREDKRIRENLKKGNNKQTNKTSFLSLSLSLSVSSFLSSFLSFVLWSVLSSSLYFFLFQSRAARLYKPLFGLSVRHETVSKVFFMSLNGKEGPLWSKQSFKMFFEVFRSCPPVRD